MLGCQRECKACIDIKGVAVPRVSLDARDIIHILICELCMDGTLYIQYLVFRAGKLREESFYDKISYWSYGLLASLGYIWERR